MTMSFAISSAGSSPSSEDATGEADDSEEDADELSASAVSSASLFSAVIVVSAPLAVVVELGGQISEAKLGQSGSEGRHGGRERHASKGHV